MTDIREMISDYLDSIQTEYIIDYYNNTIGGDTVLTKDDFDSHFDGESYLDVIDRLDGSFDASDDYFQDGYVIMSSMSLDDLINFEDLIDHLEEELENANERHDMPNGFADLYDEYEKTKKPKHTEDEIRTKLNDIMCDLPEDMVLHMATYKMKKFEFDFHPMSDFASVCANHGVPKVIGMLAISIGWFDFCDPYFEVNDDKQFISYNINKLRNEVWQGLCDNEFEDDWLKQNGYDALVEVRNGYWEE